MRYGDLILTNNDGARVAFRKCRQALEAEAKKLADPTKGPLTSVEAAGLVEAMQAHLVNLYFALEADDLQSKEL